MWRSSHLPTGSTRQGTIEALILVKGKVLTIVTSVWNPPRRPVKSWFLSGKKKWFLLKNPAGFWLGFGMFACFCYGQEMQYPQMFKKEYDLCPPFLKGNLSRKTASHVHPIFPYLSSNPSQQKCAFKNVMFHITGELQGGLVNHDTNSNNPLFSGNSMINHPSKLPQHTYLYGLLSFDLPPKNKYSHFYPIIMGLVSWTKLLLKTLRRVNWTNPTPSRGRSPWPPGLSPQRPWGLGLGWLRWWVPKYPKMGWKFMVGELNL